MHPAHEWFEGLVERTYVMEDAITMADHYSEDMDIVEADELSFLSWDEVEDIERVGQSPSK